MKRQEIIDAFVQLGDLFRLLGRQSDWQGFHSGVTEEEYRTLQTVINREQLYNPWFTKTAVCSALNALADMLQRDVLESFVARYPEPAAARRVAIIMAGNIPLVGFHDLLCVALSGHTALCKLSSEDPRLLPAFLTILKNWQPELRIEFSHGPLKNMEAVIATGSDNSANYFEQYFGRYPHIFRKNRTSVAVLSGDETPEELTLLGNDMFQYFGLGCRNVSKLLVPKGFQLNRLFEAIVDHGEIIHHHKYANNYDYNRTIYLMNQVRFLDNNFCLLKEDEGLFSPLSVFFYSEYASEDEVDAFLAQHAASIQAVVGRRWYPFGAAQSPAIDDFADGIDTMQWLCNL